MKVELISHTPDALNLLLRTKNTRMNYASDPATWTEEKRAEHLAYMRDTIRSSWEFVDYVFQISGVTRNFTHQFVRTRTGAYAQESLRISDVSDHPVETPVTIENNPTQLDVWLQSVVEAKAGYSSLLALGAAPQDARGLLPTNITTGIIAKFNLRTLSQMGELRLCTRTQGEYQNVFRAMRRLVINAHPWTEDFIQVHCVARGTCAFPRYGKKECPIYDHGVRQNEMTIAGNRHIVQRAWETIRHEASPRAKEGKAT